MNFNFPNFFTVKFKNYFQLIFPKCKLLNIWLSSVVDILQLLTRTGSYFSLFIDNRLFRWLKVTSILIFLVSYLTHFKPISSVEFIYELLSFSTNFWLRLTKKLGISNLIFAFELVAYISWVDFIHGWHTGRYWSAFSHILVQKRSRINLINHNLKNLFSSLKAQRTEKENWNWRKTSKTIL